MPPSRTFEASPRSEASQVEILFEEVLFALKMHGMAGMSSPMEQSMSQHSEVSLERPFASVFHQVFIDSSPVF